MIINASGTSSRINMLETSHQKIMCPWCRLLRNKVSEARDEPRKLCRELLCDEWYCTVKKANGLSLVFSARALRKGEGLG